MQVKTFRADSLAAALAQARAELGPDALVLARRRVPGALGLEAHEVTVGLDRAPAIPPDLTRALRLLGREASRVTPPDAPAPAPAVAGPLAAPTEERRRSSRSELLAEAEKRLRSRGLSGELITRFHCAAVRWIRPGAEDEDLRRAERRGIASLLALRPWKRHPRVLFLVGPPGAGKTTTVAKLAARLRLLEDRPVVYAQADQERIGANEQAEIFARAIGASLSPIHGPDDLIRVVRESGRKTMILVDTAGIGFGDRDRLAFACALRRAVPRAETALLLPAGLHRDEITRVLRRFEPLAPTCVGVSKVDDAHRLGDVIDALTTCSLPLAFVTDGQRIPDDFQPVTDRYLTRLLLHDAAEPAAQEML